MQRETTLRKLYYMNQNDWKQERERRFQDPDTLHLDIQIGEHPAFVCQTVSLYQKIVAIERCDRQVSRLRSQLPGVAITQFSHRCLIDEILMTNNIEGVSSSRKDIQNVLQAAQEQKKKKLRFEGLVRKYDRLMSREQIPLETCQDVRDIYDEIFYDEIMETDPENMLDGKIFRKEGVDVRSKTDRTIHSGLMPESRILSVMEQSLAFLNDDTVEPLLRIAVFHYLFGYIHPFYDGNGRTSRFISSYLLSRILDPLIGYRISCTIKNNVRQYEEMFAVCNDFRNGGDLTPFVELFVEIVGESVQRLRDELEELLKKLMYYHELVPKLPGCNATPALRDLYFLLIQAALFSEAGISRKEMQAYLECSYSTALSRLNRIPTELLRQQEQGRIKSYMLDLDAADRYLSQK